MAAKTRQRKMKVPRQRDIAAVIFKALDFISDGVALGPADGTVYYHNKAWNAIHALDEDLDLRGKSIYDVERDEMKPIVNRTMEDLFKFGSCTQQFGTVRRDGKYHDIHLSAKLIREVDPPLVIVILREITDLVQTQKKLERLNRELKILNDMHRVTISATSKAAIIKLMMQRLGAYIKADFTAVFEVDESAGYAVHLDSTGVPARFKKKIMRWPLAKSAYGRMAKSSKTYVMEQDLPGFREASNIRERMGVKRTIGCVFRTGDKNAYLVLLGLKREENIEPETRNFFLTVTNQFGTAIEKIELLGAIKEREQELQDLTMQLISEAEEEKRRCSRMLHDEVGQAITGLKLEIDMLEKNLRVTAPRMRKSLEAIKNQVRFIAGTTRTLSKTLHPSMLDELGLVETLNWYLDNVVRSDALEVELEVAGFDEEPPPPVGIALYRVAQECLANVMRHANATKVKITLTRGYPHVIMVIEDNGRGFSLAKGKSKAPGLGLVSMRERVEHMRGAFQLVSSPGKGTRVRVTIPIEAKHGK